MLCLFILLSCPLAESAIQPALWRPYIRPSVRTSVLTTDTLCNFFFCPIIPCVSFPCATSPTTFFEKFGPKYVLCNFKPIQRSRTTSLGQHVQSVCPYNLTIVWTRLKPSPLLLSLLFVCLSTDQSAICLLQLQANDNEFTFLAHAHKEPRFIHVLFWLGYRIKTQNVSILFLNRLCVFSTMTLNESAFRVYSSLAVPRFRSTQLGINKGGQVLGAGGFVN